MWLVFKLISYLGKIPYLGKGIGLLTAPASKTFKSTLAIVLMLCYIIYSSYLYSVEIHKNQFLIDQNKIFVARLAEQNKEVLNLRQDVKELQNKADLLLSKQQQIREHYLLTLDKANELLKTNSCSNVTLSNDLIKLLRQFDANVNKH